MVKLRSYEEIAVDLEHHNYRSFLGITCLIQISTRDEDYIIDALALRDQLSDLNELFTDPNRIKVFHGSESDLMWLQRDFGVYVIGLFDTGIASRVLQLPHNSLGYLLQRYVGVKANKEYQLADWRIRPLPEELLLYAQTDTHYLLHIAARMCQELEDRNLLLTVLQRSQELCYKKYTKPVFNRSGYMDLYKHAGGISFTHRQMFALENLYSLRDSIARREDESVHYVLPNHMLKVIAEKLPREVSGIFACCNPIPPLVRKYVHDMHKILLESRNLPISELILTKDASTDPTATDLASTHTSNQISGITCPSLPHDYSHGALELEDKDTDKCPPVVILAKPSRFASSFLSVCKEDCFYKAALNKFLELLKLPVTQFVQSLTNHTQNEDEQVEKDSISFFDASSRDASRLEEQSGDLGLAPINRTNQKESNSQIKSKTNLNNSEEIIMICNEKTSSKTRHRKRKRTQLESDATVDSFDLSTALADFENNIPNKTVDTDQSNINENSSPMMKKKKKIFKSVRKARPKRQT